MSRASGLEGQLNQSEAALSTALSQNAAMTSELADVKTLLAKVLHLSYVKTSSVSCDFMLNSNNQVCRLDIFITEPKQHEVKL